MIQYIEITNHLGESVTIHMDDDSPEHGFIIKKIEGLGPPKADIRTTQLATNDGSIFNSSKIGERNIVITMLFKEAPTIEDTRLRSYRYFPIKREITVTVKTDNRHVFAVGHVESNEPDIFSKEESNKISIICDDPFLYTAGDDGTNTTIFYGTDPLFEFDFENEGLEEPTIEFGSIENETEKNIYYDGDSEVGIVIEIHALSTTGDITIYNTGTREMMKISSSGINELTGHPIISGDTITIDTTRGNKKVTLLRGGYFTNILNALDRESDWFTLARGDNIFAYVTDQGGEDLEFRIYNRVVFEGV